MAQLSTLGRFALMPESKHQMILLRPKVIRNIGIVLFVLSFLAPAHPAGDFRLRDYHLFGGVMAFIQTPVFACQRVLDVGPGESLSHAVFLFVIMMTAWIANLTVFTRLPVGLALIAILLPWPAYIFLFSVLAGFIPFYPWAVGIALIHIGRLAGPGPKIEPRTILTRQSLARHDFDKKPDKNGRLSELVCRQCRRLGSMDRILIQRPNSRRSQPPLARSVPLSRFTPRVGGGSAFFVRRFSHL